MERDRKIEEERWVETIGSRNMGERKEEASNQLLGFWLPGPVRHFVEIR